MGAVNQSLLDAMSEGISGRKTKAAGPTLTPVGTEASPVMPSRVGIPDVPEVFLTNEALIDIARDLRVQASVLINVAFGLDELTGTSTLSVPVPQAIAKAAQAAAEKAADNRAASTELTPEAQKLVDHMNELKAKAQADTYTAADEVLPEVRVTNVDGWVCPEHGGDAITFLVSRRGREYRACGKCDKFQK